MEDLTSEPMVSVITPCFNASDTLPWAIGSMLAQTYQNWEMVIVDDGSTDHPENVVNQAGDSRVRLHRLEQNRGRGYARQVALSLCRGEFLAMLDADDWIVPTKLEQQVQVMLSHPELALVSTSMGIVDTNGDLIGVRSRGSGKKQEAGVVLGPLESLIPPPVPHGPSMIRMDIAKSYQYDDQLLHGQDADFMLQILLDHKYMILPEVTYIYAEHASVTEQKILRTLGFTKKMFAKHRSRFPVSSRYNVFKVWMKELVYQIGFIFGQKRRLIMNRSQAPEALHEMEFAKSKDNVSQMVGSVFRCEVPKT